MSAKRSASSGRWLVALERRGGRRSHREAVIFELAWALETAPLIVEAYGLSDRERA
jgi:hypothetical protein